VNTKKIIKSVLEWIIYAIIFIAIVWGTPKMMVKLLNTEYPIASITSSSMWPQLKEGDVVFIKGVSGKEEVRVGDVVVYRNERGFTIHRIIAMNDTTLTTKGDANNVDDTPIKYEQLVGKMIVYGNGRAIRIPWLGKLSGMRGNGK
jgi:signal peptidase I